MGDWVLKCDEVLSNVKIQVASRAYWLPKSGTMDTRKKVLRERLEFLALGSTYELSKTQQMSTKIVSLVIRHSYDLVDLDLIKTAIRIDSENKRLIWDSLRGLLPNLDKNPDEYAGNALLPYLVLAAVEKKVKHASVRSAVLKSVKEASSAEGKLRCVVKAMQEAVDCFPSDLCQALPNRKTTTSSLKVNAEGEKALKNIIHHAWGSKSDLSGLINIPADYKN